MMKAILFLLIVFNPLIGKSQSYVVRDIKSFGAVGNGKTNDHDAFIKASEFFNARGGNGKLIISKGLYLVGKQKINKKSKKQPLYEGDNLLHFNGVKNLTVEGNQSPVIKYKPNLYFGTFNPATLKPSRNGNNFFDISYAATIGNAIVFSNSSNIKVSGIELDGNNSRIYLGGIYGDVGRQLPHSGILLDNATDVIVSQLNVHHFGLDGIMISNSTGSSKKKDGLVITDCLFEYNGRQGLSWVGGNDLSVIKSGFNHTGKGGISSLPGAGVDIEAEVGPVLNGKFIDCEFINNAGCGVVADNGPSSNCLFINCTIWGVTSWSVWVRKPHFKFANCKIYGSIVHGYDATNNDEATTFIDCLFEDKAYLGKEPYGQFLIEENYARRMRFQNCTMRANKKKVVWLGWSGDWMPDEKYQLDNCRLEYLGNNHPENEWIGIFRNVRFTNTTLVISHSAAAKKKYYWNGIDEPSNLLKGRNNVFDFGKKIEKL